MYIGNGNLKAKLLPFGATLQELRIAGHAAPLTLGFDNEAAYREQKSFMGATIGRYANRIGGARFALDGVVHRLDANEGNNSLHGGPTGFYSFDWDVEASGADFVTFRCVSEDRDNGFPGTVTAWCRYLVQDDGLEISLRATSDAPTVCAMTHHSYFNLHDGGTTSINKHAFEIEADHITETDGWDIPTGRCISVGGTEYDFRSLKTISQTDLDINYCVSHSRVALRKVAHARAPSQVGMDVFTTEPGLQFYTADFLEESLPGYDGRIYGARAGFCIEAQIWPDAPNHGHFPSAVLRPGEVLEQTTVYRFSHLLPDQE